MLRPMLARYPFNPESQEDVDPGELEVLRRKDGAFWALREPGVLPRLRGAGHAVVAARRRCGRS